MDRTKSKINSSKFNISKKITDINKVEKTKSKSKKKRITLFTSVFVVLASSFGVGMSFLLTSYAQKQFVQDNTPVEPPEPEVPTDLMIANQLAQLNLTASVKDATLQAKLPNAIVSAEITLNTINFVLPTDLKFIDVALISFEVISGTANNTEGSLQVRVLYNSISSTSNRIVLTGFAKQSSINVIKQPTSISAQQTTTVSFSYVVDFVNIDPTTATYQWYKGNTALTDTASKIQGSTTAVLVLLGLTTSDAGQYKCVVTANGITSTSSNATLTITASDVLDINQLALQNLSITVTNTSLTSKYPSTIAPNNLNATNVPINSTGILGYNSTLLTFSSIFNANDELGTLQTYLSYQGRVAVTPTTISGFAKLPTTTSVLITPNTTGTNFQTYVDSIASGGNETTNFASYVVIKNTANNATITYANAVQAVNVTKTNLTGGTLQMTFTFQLKKLYYSTSPLAFTYTSSSTTP